MSEHSIILGLSVLLAILQIGDWYTTRTILNTAGGYEMNPVMRFVFKYVNRDVALALKGVLTVLAIYIIHSLVFSVFIVALYAFVVVHNWKQIINYKEAIKRRLNQ